MGRIKTTFVKRKTQELLKAHGDMFTADFIQNKQIAAKTTTIFSKKLRNTLAGYITRLKKKEQQTA